MEEVKSCAVKEPEETQQVNTAHALGGALDQKRKETLTEGLVRFACSWLIG